MVEKQKIEKIITDSPDREKVFVEIYFDDEHVCAVYLNDQINEIMIEFITSLSLEHIPALEFQEHLNEAIEFMQGIRKQAMENPTNNSDEE